MARREPERQLDQETQIRKIFTNLLKERLEEEGVELTAKERADVIDEMVEFFGKSLLVPAKNAVKFIVAGLVAELEGSGEDSDEGDPEEDED